MRYEIKSGSGREMESTWVFLGSENTYVKDDKSRHKWYLSFTQMCAVKCTGDTVMIPADMVPPFVEPICNLIGLVSRGRANSIMKKRPWGGKKHGKWMVGHVVCSPGKER